VRGETIGLTAFAVLAGVVGIAVLGAAGRRRGRVTLPSVVVVLAVVGVVVVGGAVLGARGPLGLFGVVHLGYLAAVVTVPLIGAGVLVATRFTATSVAAVAAGVVLLVPAPVGVYATHLAPFRLRIDHVAVPLDEQRAGVEPVRIAVLSDLQTVGVGDHERAAIRAVLDAEPDLILLPGDLFQARFVDLVEHGPELRALLATLSAPGGVYFVRGDVDRDERVDALLGGTDIQILDDEVRSIRVGDRTVLLGGTRKDYASAAADRVRAELLAASGNDITELFSHRPDTVLALPPSSGIDLTVAGHTHGGQFAIPGFGPIVWLSEVPRRVGGGGLHAVDGNRIYVSTGVGMERGEAPQFRLGVPPSVGVLELAGPHG
jgi:predicted MPP superfamily phosphohydrolase